MGKLNLTFHGRRDHLDPELREYKVRLSVLPVVGLSAVGLSRVPSRGHINAWSGSLFPELACQRAVMHW